MCFFFAEQDLDLLNYFNLEGGSIGGGGEAAGAQLKPFDAAAPHAKRAKQTPGLNSSTEVSTTGSSVTLSDHGATPAKASHLVEDRVDCHCGAKIDDGQYMIACELCDVWQHTQCNSILDEEVKAAEASGGG